MPARCTSLALPAWLKLLLRRSRFSAVNCALPLAIMSLWSVNPVFPLVGSPWMIVIGPMVALATLESPVWVPSGKLLTAVTW